MNNNINKLLIIVVLLLIGIIAFPQFDNTEEMNTGSVLSVSEAKLNDNNYWLVTLTQSTYADEGLFTEHKKDTVYTTVDGQEVKVDFDVEFGLDIEKTGWAMPLEKKYTSNYFANSIKDTQDSWWFGYTDLEYEYDSNQHEYYIPSSNSWDIYRKYDSYVIVNGEKFTKTTEYDTEDGFRQVIYESKNGLKPIIYEEALIAMESGTSGFPIMSKIQIIPYQNSNSMMFIDTSNELSHVETYGSQYKATSGISTTIDNIIDDEKYGSQDAVSWNDVIGGKQYGYQMYSDPLSYYIDLDGDSEIDSNDINEDFTWDEFVTNSKMKFKFASATGDSNVFASVPNPKDYEYSPKPAYNNYEIITSGNYKNTLLYETPLKITGTWQIPIEYGDISIVEKEANFEIVDKGTISDITDNYGETIAFVDIRCIEGEGKASVELIKVDESIQVQIKDPSSVDINLKEGETQRVEFKLIGNDVNNDLDGKIKIVIQGGTTEIIDYIEYNIIDTDKYNQNDLIYIEVKAISDTNEYLDTHPVIVNGDKQYGTWEGDVIKGVSLTVNGEFYEGYTPEESFKILPSNNGDVYQIKYLSTGSYGETDYSLLIMSLFIILLTVIAGYAIYYYKNMKKR